MCACGTFVCILMFSSCFQFCCGKHHILAISDSDDIHIMYEEVCFVPSAVQPTQKDTVHSGKEMDEDRVYFKPLLENPIPQGLVQRDKRRP